MDHRVDSVPLRRLALAALAVTVILAAVPAAAQTEVSGQAANGSYYRIQVPAGWQPSDGLVIWNHGFDLAPPTPNPDLGPLADVHLAEGFAVAASSYSLNGWAVFQTREDLRLLYQAFVRQFGEPAQVFVYGGSLGGIVTARALEDGGIGNVVGALPICGAVGGSRIWNGALDLRLAYDFVCGDVPGAAIPGGARGLPFPPDPSLDAQALALAVNACTGVLLPPSLRMPDQQARLERLLAITDLPEEFVLTDMGFATFALADLINDPRKLAGASALGNAEVVYGDAAVDAAITRATPDPAALRRLIENYTPTGRIGDVKIVSIHTDKDGLVLIENESEYAAAVPAANFTLGVVVEDVPTHCGFTAAEVVGAWEALRAWVAGAPKPSAATLQTVCEGIAGGGLADGPCRIDPGFTIADLNGRVRPRAACEGVGGSLCLNGRFRAAVSWRDFQGTTGVGRPGEIATADTGTFWFFNPENLEMMVKVLDGRQINGHFWVFYGSLTNVGFDLRVIDSETGLERTFANGVGAFASAGTTEAF